MAAAFLTIKPSSSSSSASLIVAHNAKASRPATPKLRVSLCYFPLLRRHRSIQLRYPEEHRALAAVEGEAAVAEKDGINDYSYDYDQLTRNDDVPATQLTNPSNARPCELYVCNLPRSSDIPQLVDMFKSFGNVLSVEVPLFPFLFFFFSFIWSYIVFLLEYFDE